MSADITPLFTKPHVVDAPLSAAERVLTSHRIVEAASAKLDDGEPQSGAKLLGYALSLHLTLTMGKEEAAAFFETMADRCRSISPRPAA